MGDAAERRGRCLLRRVRKRPCAAKELLRLTPATWFLWTIFLSAGLSQSSNTFAGTVGESWSEQMRELTAYRQRYGTLDLLHVTQGPKSSNGYEQSAEEARLRQWLQKQRLEIRHGRMSPGKCAALEQIGVTLSSHSKEWQQRFEDLCCYKQHHGHTGVALPDDAKMFRWTITQRTRCRRGMLDPHRLAMLSRLGFIWSRNEADWESKFHELRELVVTAHGRTDEAIDAACSDNLALYRWICSQRTQHRTGRLPI
ncbi:hypothetical protein T484DRAFT_1915393, partial [Baffinella frigidus]